MKKFSNLLNYLQKVIVFISDNPTSSGVLANATKPRNVHVSDFHGGKKLLQKGFGEFAPHGFQCKALLRRLDQLKRKKR